MALTMFWIVAIVMGILAVPLGIMIAVLLKPKDNIDFVITQTFLGNDKVIFKKGIVEVDPAKPDMAMYKFIEGYNKISCGKFHQKYLHPGMRGRMVCELEEWEVGRYRPKIYGGVIEEEDLDTTSKLVPEVGPDGKIITNWFGKPKMKMQLDSTVVKRQARQMISVTNDDFDWIMREKEAAVELAKKKEENKHKWLPWVAGGLLAIFIMISAIVTAYYSHESAIISSASTAGLAVATQELSSSLNIFAKAFNISLVNGTVQESKPMPDAPPPGGP